MIRSTKPYSIVDGTKLVGSSDPLRFFCNLINRLGNDMPCFQSGAYQRNSDSLHSLSPRRKDASSSSVRGRRVKDIAFPLFPALMLILPYGFYSNQRSKKGRSPLPK